jgi:hypothetical protein
MQMGLNKIIHMAKEIIKHRNNLLLGKIFAKYVSDN